MIAAHRQSHSLSPSGRIAGLGRDEEGQSLVEFAITFSILMSFVFMFIEVCLAFYSYGMISERAREGSRYAAVRGSTCVNSASVSCTATAAAINTYVSQIGYPDLGGGAMTVNTTFPDGNQASGSRVRVSISYVLPVTVPLVPRNSIALSTSSQMYIVQ